MLRPHLRRDQGRLISCWADLGRRGGFWYTQTCSRRAGPLSLVVRRLLVERVISGGLRSITVEGQRFRWRFDDHLVVTPNGRSSPQLRVEWGWRDWLEPEVAGAERKVVTPRFVAEAIGFALSQGWKPAITGSPFSLCYRDGRFWAADRNA